MDKKEKKTKEIIIDDTDVYYPPDYMSGDPGRLLKQDIEKDD